jgi:FtsH-binding integral membrane protein
MATYASAAPAISGPSEERHAFLKRTALWTFIGLLVAGVVGGISTVAIAPAILASGRYGGTVVVLVTFLLAHFVARKMVYSGAKVPGFILAVLSEGIALGVLLLTAVLVMGMDAGAALVVQALGLTAATAGGMLVYVWFSKGEMKLLGAFLAMAFVPMLILMAIGIFFPIGGTFGLIISAAFVLVSAGGLLYRLNFVVHNLDTNQHVEGAYEITMGVLVLLWNIITLLMRLRR